MEFKEGQKVRVTDRKHGHGFDISEDVIIHSILENRNSYLCTNGESLWYLGREEFKEINPKTITTYENQPIEELAKEVAELVKKEWGSHNIEPFIEAFKKEVGLYTVILTI